MTEIISSYFSGDVLLLKHKVHADQRGSFIKIFNQDAFSELKLNTYWVDEYTSWSHKNVLRGMHLQTGPFKHYKLVTCMKGNALDVVIDLRSGSASYGEYACFELDSGQNQSVYIAPGFAHGFLSRTMDTLMHYKVSTTHSPEYDTGIRWDSFNFDWGAKDIILSSRDKQLSPMVEFENV